MQDASNQAEQIAASRWQAHSVDRLLRLLGLLGLAAALVLALAYAAPYAEELIEGSSDG